MKKPLFEASFRVTKESCRALAKAKSSQYFRTVWVCNALIALGVTILWVIGSYHARWLTVVLAALVLHSALGLRRWLRRAVARRCCSDREEDGADVTGDVERFGRRLSGRIIK